MTENEYYGVMGSENDSNHIETIEKSVNTSKTPPPSKPSNPPGGIKIPESTTSNDKSNK